MKIKEALIHAQQELNDYSDSPRIDAELLLMHICNYPKTRLYSHNDEILNESQITRLKQGISYRQHHMPMAYIIGYKEFWSLDFTLSLATLVPRPATEALVAYVLKHKTEKNLNVLDLGTGSGAIAISLAKEQPSWNITAVDLNPAALSMAIHNAKRHQCQHIQFLQSNWFSRLAGMHFDIIISNPPYIAKNDLHLSQGDVQNEPLLALVSDDNGYFDLTHVISHSQKYLNPNGMLLLEHGHQQQDTVLKKLTLAGFKHVEGHADLDQLARFCVAY